jgi:hypothetical protein
MNIVRQTFAAATTGAQNPIGLDYLPISFITAAAVPATGADTYTIQVTLDEVFDQTDPQYLAPASATWHTVTGAPTTAVGYLTFNGPWRAIRINIAANTTGFRFLVGQGIEGRGF